MLTDNLYELCLPILNDEALEEEDKTDKLEELLRKESALTGRALGDAVLRALWRHRDAKNPPLPSPPVRHIVNRRGSPAPWQIPRVTTPLASPSLTGASPASSHGFGGLPANLARAKSSTASPFTSPRPSPRLAFTSPIPHSPNLNSYEFSEAPSHLADYGDLGSDAVDWLVNEGATSRPTSSGAGSAFESSLNGAATPWIQPQQTEMSPYDMLRSILGESKTDAEIEAALQANSYDLSATIATLMSSPDSLGDQNSMPANDGQVLVGKSMQSPPTLLDQSPGKSPVICKYWLATGSCLRADCRFSHEFGSTICRYWLMGNCLAGDTCVFSHDPAALVSDISLGGNGVNLDPGAITQPSLQVQDYDAFPILQAAAMNQWAQTQGGVPPFGSNITRSLSNTSFASAQSMLVNASSPRSFGSRPTSRHSSRAPTPSIPAVDDTDAFPTLGSVTAKGGKKHHGKRGGHGHGSAAKESVPSSIADVVRMSPSPVPGSLRKGLMKSRSYVGSRENSAAANAIPAPEHIPWLETGERANQTYLKARQDAFKHGGLRNKFLQSAAQAWNRNDARAAKALSLRGQSENDLMRKAHREAARILYDERSKDTGTPRELYVDLHGLHPEEAVEYLERVLLEQQSSPRPVYAITGTGHHSKNGKDKVGKAVRQWLVEWKYAFREFSVPGDRGNVGGILGIDARIFDKGLLKKEGGVAVEDAGAMTSNGSDTPPAKGQDEQSVDTRVKVVPTGPKAAAVKS